MVRMEKIRQLGQDIGRECRAEKVILFGSYANGNPGPDSDVDLLVIARYKGKSAWKSSEILNKLDPDFAVDLVVRSPAQVRRRLKQNDFFLKEILQSGKVVYEANNR